MKKFTINCDFGGQMAPFAIYIGIPKSGHHPLHFQADWLSKARGGMIPGEVMEAVTQLQELAIKNNVSLEELCVYALGTEDQQAELENENNSGKATKTSKKKKSSKADKVKAASEEDHTKHEIDDHNPHNLEEEIEDMSSEGGKPLKEDE